MPYYWIFELIAPLLELVGLVLIALGFALGLVSWQYFLLFMLVAYAYAIIVTLAAVTVEELSFHKYPAGGIWGSPWWPRCSRTWDTGNSPRGGGWRAGSPRSLDASRSGAP